MHIYVSCEQSHLHNHYNAVCLPVGIIHGVFHHFQIHTQTHTHKLFLLIKPTEEVIRFPYSL